MQGHNNSSKYLLESIVYGGRLNIKMLSYRYKDPHVKDKTV